MSGLFMKIIMHLLVILLICHLSSDIQPQSLTEKIAAINMKTFHWEDEWLDEHDTFDVFLKKMLKGILAPHNKRKRNLAFNLFREQGKKRSTEDENLVGSTTWKDLNLFKGSSDKNKYLACLINRTQTEVGTVALFSLLAAPTTSVATIKNRQEVIKTFLKNQQLQEALVQQLAPLQKPESALLSFWHQCGFKQSTRRCYFETTVLKSLNDSHEALLVRSSSAHASKTYSTFIAGLASAALISYGAIYATNFCEIPEKLDNFVSKNKTTGGSFALNTIFNWIWDVDNRFVHSAAALAAGAWCGITAFENYKQTCSYFLIEKCVHKLTIKIAQFFKSARVMYDLINTSPVLYNFNEFQPLVTFFKQSNEASTQLQELLGHLSSETFEGKATHFSNKGVILRTYKLIDQVKTELEDAIIALGKIDAYLALAKLMQDNAQQKVVFSFAEFAESETPLIIAEDFWHPFIEVEKVVPNSIALGVSNYRPNVILTGPNEGGKSTAIKALATCVIMAQSIGIVPARSFVCTPFSLIATALRITDDVGAGQSHFRASIIRAQEIADSLSNLQPHQYGFAIFDEIFNGTSPQEGESSAYSLAKNLGNLKNSISLISTHFNRLTDLENESEAFSNYKISDSKNAGGLMEYPFLLERGSLGLRGHAS
jgi:DNA mismatch repair protein MutS